MSALLVALGALIGAPLRYVVDRAMQRRQWSTLPLGTLTVNVVASFVLGIVVGAAADPTISALIATGFCGSLSTYSTFAYETMRLGSSGDRRGAGLNVVISLVAGIGFAALGWWLGGLIFR